EPESGEVDLLARFADAAVDVRQQLRERAPPRALRAADALLGHERPQIVLEGAHDRADDGDGVHGVRRRAGWNAAQKWTWRGRRLRASRAGREGEECKEEDKRCRTSTIVHIAI